jgi:hypothetical protein
MSTPYSDLYSRFTNKITDYNFDGLSQSEAEDIFLGYLKSAIPKFFKCKQDLTDRDDTLGQFNIDLTEIEQEILANLMVIEWINTKINHSELLEQTLSSKDFKMYSPANLLKEMRETKKELQSDNNYLLSNYYYDSDLSDLR